VKTKRESTSNPKDEGALETVARTIGATLGTISAGTTRVSKAARNLTAGSKISRTRKKASMKKPARRKTVRRTTTRKRRRARSKA
jgi:hypothetical protein